MSHEVIIIKKVVKGGHGHHGSAWKVSHADFVTAMMAFFLLMWVLNATTEDQKKGISDYFSPVSISTSTGGAGGLLGGRTVSSPRAMPLEPPFLAYLLNWNRRPVHRLAMPKMKAAQTTRRQRLRTP